MTEKELEKILTDEVKKAGGRSYKWISPGNIGVPDRIVILPNRAPVFVELKSATGKTTPMQEKQIRRLHQLGQKAAVIKGPLELIGFFEYYWLDAAANRLAERIGR